MLGGLNKLHKERIAFWLMQVVTVFVTVASIWFASRIGYEEAVRFSQWEAVRHERNLLRAAEHELVLNERALRHALSDLGSESFRNVYVVTRAYDRVRQGDGFLELDRAAVLALSKAYSSTLAESIEKVHQGETGSVLLGYARTLTRHLEHMEESIPLVQAEVEALDAKLSVFGVPDIPLRLSTSPHPPAAELSEVEVEALGRTATPGWKHGASPSPYTGELREKIYWDSPIVPPQLRGPVVIEFNGRHLPRERKVKRVFLCFAQRAPLPVWTEVDEPWQRRALAGDNGPGSFVMELELPKDDRLQIYEILDPNPELGWRWVYLVLEDDLGVRSAAKFSIWKVGEKNDGWHLKTKLTPERLLVLPKGYTP